MSDKTAARFFNRKNSPIWILGILNPTVGMEEKLMEIIQPDAVKTTTSAFFVHKGRRVSKTGRLEYMEIEDCGNSGLALLLREISGRLGIEIKYGDFTREDLGLPPVETGLSQRSKRMKVRAHSGHLSVENGAHAPLSFLFELPKITDYPSYVVSGEHYYDDAIDIDERDWPAIEGILIEAKMLYKLDPGFGFNAHLIPWLNVQTDTVRRKLRIPQADVVDSDSQEDDAQRGDRPS